MDIAKILQDINNFDLADLKQIGSAPAAARISVIVLLCAGVIALGIWLLIISQLDQLKILQDKEQNLKAKFSIIHNKSSNLEAYKVQLDEMKVSFGAMLRQLPDTTDIESLLIDLSQTSVASGLDVRFFKPGNEQHKGFYAQHPIALSVIGRYHQFGSFISGLASLPRIITIHDISISSAEKSSPGKLKMELTAMTYRYLDEGKK